MKRYRRFYIWKEVDGAEKVAKAFQRYFPGEDLLTLWTKAKVTEVCTAEYTERSILPRIIVGYTHKDERTYLVELKEITKLPDGLRCANCRRLQSCRILYNVKVFQDECTSKIGDFLSW